MIAVIVYGPQGCGKSTNAEAMRRHFGVARVVDGYAPGDELPGDTLALTNVPGVAGALDYADVMREMAA